MTERFIPRSRVERFLPRTATTSTPRFKIGDRYTMRIDRGAQRWMYQQALRNLWRMSGWYDIDDLVQEGLLCWHKVASFYRDTVHDRPHMMRLFQRSYQNRLHALAKERTKRLTDWQGDVVVETAMGASRDDEEGSRGKSLLREHGDGGEQAAAIELSGLLANAPEPVRRLFAILQSDEGLRRLHSLYRRYADGTRETFNQRVAKLIGWSDGPHGSRLVGWSSEPDFYNLLKDYLGD